MKKIHVTLICYFSFIIFAFGQSNFDIGFKDGFKNGYCYSNNQSSYTCNPPIPPLTPLLQINENQNSYQDGYNRGFLFGQARRRTEDNSSSNTNVNPNSPPKFNPYVPQSPILSLTPQERAAYYAAKARRDQEAIEALGNALDEIFTVTPEGLARRAVRKAKRLEEKYRREELNRITKEEREKLKIIVYGIKAGVNISSFDGSSSIINKSLIGPQVGGFAEIKLNNKVSIQPELLLSMQGSELEYSFYYYENKYRSKINLYYLNLPVIVKYNIVDKFEIFAGPQIGCLIKAIDHDKTKKFDIRNNDETYIKNVYETISYSFNFGLNYKITEQIFADLRYNYGLTNIVKANNYLLDSGPTNLDSGKTNNLFQISIGYRL